MKIKLDFITNSSSSSFILAFKEDYVSGIYELIDELNEKMTQYGISEQVFSNVDDLNFYTNGERELDWVQKATGPRYEYLPKETYEECVRKIDDGFNIMYISADYELSDPLVDYCDRNKIDIFAEFG